MGFFGESAWSQVSAAVLSQPQCGACGLYKQCQTPKMLRPYGKGRKKIMVIGETNGKTEDERGRPFVGKSGRFLRPRLQKFGIDLDRDCWTFNSLGCRPPGNIIEDNKWIGYCQPNVINVVQEFQPEVILLFGAVPVQSLIGWLWKENPGSISRWINWQIPCQRLNAWVSPMWHPSHVMRPDYEGGPVNETRAMLWEQNIEASLANVGSRPWLEVPDYRSRVRVTLDDTEAASSIRRYIVQGKIVSFDFETNMAKPDSREGQIICCAVSDGKTAIAFPWMGKAKEVMKELIRSPVPKVNANIKFEDRWCGQKLGVRPHNWVWDTMLAAHILNCWEGICSLKFQAFVRLGQESYNDHIAPYLESKNGGGNERNRIKEVDMESLLLYCGLDTVLAVELAKVQAKDMGVVLANTKRGLCYEERNNRTKVESVGEDY